MYNSIQNDLIQIPNVMLIIQEGVYHISSTYLHFHEALFIWVLLENREDYIAEWHCYGFGIHYQVGTSRNPQLLAMFLY